MIGNTSDPATLLSVGDMAERAGITVSALHFFERQGLIESTRTAGNQRRYRREVLRRVAFIRVASRAGIPLKEVGEALHSLPENRTPTRKDWEHLSELWRQRLDGQIQELQQLRDDFTGCIGCGCLSLDRCAMLNPQDQLARHGAGPQLLRKPEV